MISHKDTKITPPAPWFVVPAKAGIQLQSRADWVPAFAGMTNEGAGGVTFASLRLCAKSSHPAGAVANPDT
jgi:hypothetical protein